MLDYPALAALAAVIRTGSFDAAAEALSVTPSAVSQRVKGLEERLGLPLVIRATPCRPTEAGARLAAHLDQVALLEHDMMAGDPVWAAAFGGARPTLKIALNADSLGTWFPGAAARFAAAQPNTLSLVLDDEAVGVEGDLQCRARAAERGGPDGIARHHVVLQQGHLIEVGR